MKDNRNYNLRSTIFAKDMKPTDVREIWVIEKQFTLSWIPRLENKAGWLIEQQYGL
jgi:hypothetical protein